MEETSARGLKPNKSAPFDRERLKRRRALARLNQKELSERSGISTQHISRLELGTVGCSVETLHKLAMAIGCDPADLMPEESGVDA